MKIFGTQGITTTPEKGEFFCPTCNSLQSYDLKRVRRFFVLTVIPLIPLDKIGEYVECLNCKDSYNTSVLNMPFESSLDMEAEYNMAIKKVMIHVLLADGIIDDAEVTTCQKINKRVTGKDLDSKTLRVEIENIKESKESLSKLSKLQGCLNDEGKELVIQAAYYVALADGEYHEEEQNLIMKIGTLLGMTKAHVDGVLGSLSME